MHVLIALCIVVALVFGGLFMITQAQENHIQIIRAETSQEHTRALDRSHLETTRAQNQATLALAFNAQVQTFSLALGNASNIALSWATLFVVAGGVVGLVVVLLSRQQVAATQTPQIEVYKPMTLSPGMTRPELLAAVDQYLQLQRHYQAKLPEVVDGECRRY